jgi:hypothetical protein
MEYNLKVYLIDIVYVDCINFVKISLSIRVQVLDLARVLAFFWIYSRLCFQW